MTPAIEALEALARRAVACRGWRWMPGMLLSSPRSWGLRIVTGPIEEHADAAPVLTDPATLGCLLALVREAWGDPYLIATKERGSCWIIAIHLCDAMLVGGRYIRGATEIEALIAALEAAP
jgi:hypothetical protein